MKQSFHARVPLAMDVFSASIMGGGLGASLSPWVTRLLDSWHAGLAVLALLACIALACWYALEFVTARKRPPRTLHMHPRRSART